jgi:hypothetical protein
MGKRMGKTGRDKERNNAALQSICGHLHTLFVGVFGANEHHAIIKLFPIPLSQVRSGSGVGGDGGGDGGDGVEGGFSLPIGVCGGGCGACLLLFRCCLLCC